MKTLTGQMAAAMLLVLMAAPTAMAHQGHTNSAPWEACHEHSLGDLCAWNDTEGSLYQGTCRDVGKSLLCIRNKPIQKASAKPHTDDHKLQAHGHKKHTHQHHDEQHRHKHAPPSQPGPLEVFGVISSLLALIGGMVWFQRQT